MIFFSLTELTKRLTQRPITCQGYLRSVSKMLSFGIKLEDIIHDSERVKNYLKHDITVHEFSNAYSAVIAYIKVMDIDNKKKEDLITIYRQYYKERSDELLHTRKMYIRKEERNNGYNYVSFRQKVKSCLLLEKNLEHRLLMSLFVNIPPRRTSDYICLRINIEDDDLHNILIWTDKRKTFIFNDWKAVNKIGKQIIDITNNDLIEDIRSYITDFSDTIIFDHKSSWISSACKLISKKHKIPFSVYDIRHMFATYMNDKGLPEPHKEAFAIQMGTSLDYINTSYDDHKHSRHVKTYSVNIDDIINDG